MALGSRRQPSAFGLGFPLYRSPFGFPLSQAQAQVQVRWTVIPRAEPSRQADRRDGKLTAGAASQSRIAERTAEPTADRDRTAAYCSAHGSWLPAPAIGFGSRL